MNESAYQYLNLENEWPSFVLEGLVNLNGLLQLAPVPGEAESVGPPLDPVAQLSGPAGIGVDEWNNLYLADAANHRIVRVDGCDGQSAALACLRGPGAEPGQLDGPRGVAVGNGSLYVADSGNHRIQVIDLGTLQIRAVWGQPDPYASPMPDAAPGRFDEPWDVAVDAAGDVYVVDHGNRRVQKFNPAGRVLDDFWETMAASTSTPQEPAAVAVTRMLEEERILVVDRAANTVLVYGLDGSFDDAATEIWQNVPAYVTSATDAVASEGLLYVADSAGRVLVFDQEGTFLGPASGPQQPVAGIALDCAGRLLVHPGGGAAVQQFTPSTAFGECGVFLAGPFTAGVPETRWHRLQVQVGSMAQGCHVRFFTYSSMQMSGEGSDRPLSPVTCTLTEAGASPGTPAPLDTWRAAPTDADDFLLDLADGRYLWLAGLLQGDGTATPVLEQMRLTYDHETWTRFMPSVHQQNPVNRAALDKSLSLFESLLDDEQDLIELLPRLFDPWSAPDEHAPHDWLDWLAGWLAFDLDETWVDAQRRDALAEAFGQYARRGTVESLRYLIGLYAGATAHISEPSRMASLWSLGEFSTLGADTMLAPAEPQGAVVGTTANLDHSHLIEEEDYGAPLFEDTAHRFCIQVYAADLVDGQTVKRVQQVVDREKPAHTSYHICPIEATMRVGFQARLGIDTIVAGAATSLVVDAQQRLGLDTALSDSGTGHAMGHGTLVGRPTAVLN